MWHKIPNVNSTVEATTIKMSLPIRNLFFSNVRGVKSTKKKKNQNQPNRLIGEKQTSPHAYILGVTEIADISGP